MTTIAGTGEYGFVDGDALTQAKFSNVFGLALCFHTDGNIYVADRSNHSIRKITPQGQVITVAGNGTPGFTNGTGSQAQFNFPFGLDIDSLGNIYVADAQNCAIRKITPLGVVTTVAGLGPSLCGLADGDAQTAKFFLPTDIATDKQGNVWVSEIGTSRIRKISFDINGNALVTTITGSWHGYQDGPVTQALFHRPLSIDFSQEGNLIIADEGNHRIRKITPAGMVSTIAGSSQPDTVPGLGDFADGDGLTQAMFNSPSGVVIDESGFIYISDRCNNRIRKINLSGIVTTIAGSGTMGCGNGGFMDGIGSVARFNDPYGICHDGQGNLIVGDAGNARVRKVTVGFSPKVTYIQPKIHALHQESGTPIIVNFSLPINPNSVNLNSFRVIGELAGDYSGTYSFSDSNKTLTYTPANSYKKGENIKILVSNKIKGSNGLPIKPFISDFTVRYIETPGLFTIKTDYKVGKNPIKILPADFNNDGLLDLAVVNYGDDKISLLYNDPLNPGIFNRKDSIATGHLPYDLATLDINKDGYSDLVYSNLINTWGNIGKMQIFINDQGEGFSADTTFITLKLPYSLDINDIDRDGNLDIITGSHQNAVEIFYFDDFGKYKKYYGNPYLRDRVQPVKAVDFDNDGDIDLTFAGNFGSYRTISNDGFGMFKDLKAYSTPKTICRELAFADLDNDGFIDPVVGYLLNNISLTQFRNINGEDFIIQPSSLYTGESPGTIFLADIEGDGDMDLIAGHKPDDRGYSITIFENDGNGNFSKKTGIYSDSSWTRDVIIADLDNDGDGDLISANADKNSISVRYNSSYFPFDSPSTGDTLMIQGSVFWDENENGIQDTSEKFISNQKVQIIETGDFVSTNSKGQFEFYLEKQFIGMTFHLRVIPDESDTMFLITYPADNMHEVLISNALSGMRGVGFGIMKPPPPPCNVCFPSNIVDFSYAYVKFDGPLNINDCQNFTVFLVFSNPCSGVLQPYKIKYSINLDENNCIQSFGTSEQEINNVTLTIGGEYSTSNSICLGNSNCINKNIKINVELFINGTDLSGSWSCELIEIAYSPIQTITGALDPNFKLTLPQGCGTKNLISITDTLETIIHFQNIGNAPAKDVIIVDSLDDGLDLTTFQIIEGSHNFNYIVDENNSLVVNFPDINLPDSLSEVEASQGFIKYKILPKQNLIPGTIIQNTAYIYFDQNEAVITNTPFHTIADIEQPEAPILEGNQAICEGETATFTASEGLAYQWNTGEKTRSINKTLPGTYSVTVYYTNSCENIVSAALTVNKNPFVNLGNDQTFYLGYNQPPLYLSANTDSNVVSYLWSTGETTSVIEASVFQSASYSLTVTNNFGCTASDEINVSIQDVRCGKKKDKVIVCHFPPDNPNNFHELCIDKHSLPEHFSHNDRLGICVNSNARLSTENHGSFTDNLKHDIIKIYPNPSENLVQLDLLIASYKLKIEFYSLLGTKLEEILSVQNNNITEKSLIHSLEKYDAGIYFYKILTNQNVTYYKLTILR